MTEIKTRRTVVTLFQGDDYDALNQQIDTFTATARQARIGDLDEVVDQQNAYNEFAEAAAERGVKIPMHHLPRKQWRGMKAKHPARPDNKGDAEVGYNRDTIGDDLVPASIDEGTFPSIADQDNFLDSLCDADFLELVNAALDLNDGSIDPKARLSLLPTQKSDVTSNSPENER
jgi:hypothetical protein